jgi:hypothetical protein
VTTGVQEQAILRGLALSALPGAEEGLVCASQIAVLQLPLQRGDLPLPLGRATALGGQLAFEPGDLPILLAAGLFMGRMVISGVQYGGLSFEWKCT